ncbi:MAG TPA: hypothetical protein VI138_07215 [Candidatus Dormibacteraeota bacterium]
MSQQSPGGARPPGDDPNLSVDGARQRRGPFWIEEPRWFWALTALVLVLGLALFLIAVAFDRP